MKNFFEIWTRGCLLIWPYQVSYLIILAILSTNDLDSLNFYLRKVNKRLMKNWLRSKRLKKCRKRVKNVSTCFISKKLPGKLLMFSRIVTFHSRYNIFMHTHIPYPNGPEKYKMQVDWKFVSNWAMSLQCIIYSKMIVSNETFQTLKFIQNLTMKFI